MAKKLWGARSEDLQVAIDFKNLHRARKSLDIGGNKDFTFPGAISVGWGGEVKVDLNCDQLPFEDKEFDFIYSRHTIEDLAYPTHILKEMGRIAKCGYIETPSIKSELTRGVDAYGSHRGYAHHRWYVGNDAESLVLIAKYPVSERYLDVLGDEDLQWWTNLTPDQWNHRFFWSGELKFKICEHENGVSVSQWDGFTPRTYLDFVLKHV